MPTNNKLKIYLKAFTLAELLIYMIIAGIIFLSVMEGFSLLGRYSSSRTAEIVSGSDFYNGYHRLAGIVTSADSIAAGNFGDAEVYSCGELIANLSVADSLLVAERGPLKDTLLRRVSSIKIIKHDADIRHTDSLAITIYSPKSQPLNLVFGISPRKEKAVEISVIEKEKKYDYE